MNVRKIQALLCMGIFFACFSSAAEEKKAKKENFFGWIGAPTAVVDTQVGLVRMVLRGAAGTFQFYGVDKSGGNHALFSLTDEGSSSYFELKVGRAVYKLQTGGLITNSKKIDNGGQLLYEILNRARVTVNFTGMKSRPDHDGDIIKVSVTVTNSGQRTEEYALKAVFDTVLGESTGPHFSTAVQPAVNAESQFRSMQKERWLLSSDGKTAVQLLLAGADITPPSAVTLGNKDILASSVWLPIIVTERPFDNVLSYNNSAVAVNWETVSLAPGASSTIVFYFAVATDGEKAPGALFIGGDEEKPAEPVAETKPAAAPEQPAPIEPFAAETQQPAVEAPKPAPAVKFEVPPVTNEQLDPVYIRGLIDRINKLEDDGKNVNREELLRLNAELDAILEKLRQQH